MKERFVRNFTYANLRLLSLNIFFFCLNLIAFFFHSFISTIEKYLLSLKIKLKSFVGLRRNHFRAVLSVLLILGMEIVNCIGHYVFWIHRFL